MTNCKDFEQSLFDHVDGLLSREMRKKVDIHFTQCTACRTVYENAELLRARLRKLEPVSASENFDTVLRTRISMELGLSRRRTLQTARLPVYATVGALLLIGAFFVYNSSNLDFLDGMIGGSQQIASSQPNNPSQSASPNNALLNQQRINYPMDLVNVPRGTPINSASYEKQQAKIDSLRDAGQDQRIQTVEF